MMGETLEKAWAAKDYGRLVPVQKVRSDGRRMTYWTLPEDAKQGQMFDGETGGKESASGSRGYQDAVVEQSLEYKVRPLVKEISAINKEMAGKFKFKYENYVFDQDTMDLDMKADLNVAYYMKKLKQYPSERKDWIEEYRRTNDLLVSQINNRKRSMLRAKVGQPVRYRDTEAKITGFTERGFPIVKTPQGTFNAFWEEVAQSVLDNRS